MILKASVTFSFDRAAADIQKVRGLRAIELDDIHGRHGEAGAVHEAADIAVELHVGEIVARGQHLGCRSDDNQRHLLLGNTRSEATEANDRGLVDDGLPMEHMVLQLTRPAQQEQAVRTSTRSTIPHRRIFTTG